MAAVDLAVVAEGVDVALLVADPAQVVVDEDAEGEVAGLEAPMIESISALVLDLAGAEEDVLTELGLSVDSTAEPVAVVDESLQTRVGISVGTAIRFGA